MLLSQWVMTHIRLLFLLWGLAALTTLSSDFLLGHHMILLSWCILIILALFFDKFLGGLRRALRAGSLAGHVQVFDVTGVLAHALVALLLVLQVLQVLHFGLALLPLDVIVQLRTEVHWGSVHAVPGSNCILFHFQV